VDGGVLDDEALKQPLAMGWQTPKGRIGAALHL
jgi:hypothetical protein